MYCSRLALSLNKIGCTSAKENHSQVDIPILDKVVLYSMALEYSTIFFATNAMFHLFKKSLFGEFHAEYYGQIHECHGYE